MKWNKDYKDILSLIGISATIFIGYFERITGGEISAYEKMNLLLIGYTGLVIAWYTKETFDLKVLTRKSLLSSVQPVLTAIEYHPYLVLVNVGRGIAISIKWQDYGDLHILSDSNLFCGIIEPHSNGFTHKQSLLTNLLCYQLSYKGTGRLRVYYDNERGDHYYSDIKIMDEKALLIKSGSSKDLK